MIRQASKGHESVSRSRCSVPRTWMQSCCAQRCLLQVPLSQWRCSLGSPTPRPGVRVTIEVSSIRTLAQSGRCTADGACRCSACPRALRMTVGPTFFPLRTLSARVECTAWRRTADRDLRLALSSIELTAFVLAPNRQEATPNLRGVFGWDVRVGHLCFKSSIMWKERVLARYP